MSHSVPLYPLPIIDVSFQWIGRDMVGPLLTTASGNGFILEVVDYTTRWPEAFSLPVGVPEEILMTVTQILCQVVEGALPAAWHTEHNHHSLLSSTDGLVEIPNGIIKNMIRRTSKLWPAVGLGPAILARRTDGPQIQLPGLHHRNYCMDANYANQC